MHRIAGVLDCSSNPMLGSGIYEARAFGGLLPQKSNAMSPLRAIGCPFGTRLYPEEDL